jgi:3-methylcrotonyl-CoA carboxylase alpha subunit
MEAMKMEHTIVAPRAGAVAEVRVAEGEQVDAGRALVVLEET